MELVPEFIKDLSSNYMVLCPSGKEEESFTLKMLARNEIDGLLKIEIKVIDNQKYYYYDITGKQPLSEMVASCPVSFLQLQKIYGKLLVLPDICREFLIHENGIFVNPDFIYVDMSWHIWFCYYPGLDEALQEQMEKFTEYLLNRVDYKEERAVLAIYALYQVSHEKICTLKKLKDVFERQCNREEQEESEDESDKNNKSNKSNGNKGVESRIKKLTNQELLEARKESKEEKGTNGKKEKEEKEEQKQQNREKREGKKERKDGKEEGRKVDFPYMKERTEGQKEVLKYSWKAYVQAVAVLILGLCILFALLKAGVFHVGGRPDIRRYIAAVICYAVALGAAFLFIFRKENQFTEIEEEIDYIDWEEDYDSLPMPKSRDLVFHEEKEIEENYYQDAFLKETGSDMYRGNRAWEIEGREEENDGDMATELLVDFRDNSIAYIESEFSGERIYLKKFPFLVGKLKKGTDYVLENNKISRIHAKFDYDESHHYIEDMDSTNGTSLNGIELLAHDRRVLSDGDRICLADKNFIFHC